MPVMDLQIEFPSYYNSSLLVQRDAAFCWYVSAAEPGTTPKQAHRSDAGTASRLETSLGFDARLQLHRRHRACTQAGAAGGT